jgi:hypothetical protein
LQLKTAPWPGVKNTRSQRVTTQENDGIVLEYTDKRKEKKQTDLRDRSGVKRFYNLITGMERKSQG